MWIMGCNSQNGLSPEALRHSLPSLLSLLQRKRATSLWFCTLHRGHLHPVPLGGTVPAPKRPCGTNRTAALSFNSSFCPVLFPGFPSNATPQNTPECRPWLACFLQNKSKDTELPSEVTNLIILSPSSQPALAPPGLHRRTQKSNDPSGIQGHDNQQSAGKATLGRGEEGRGREMGEILLCGIC